VRSVNGRFGFGSGEVRRPSTLPKLPFSPSFTRLGESALKVEIDPEPSESDTELLSRGIMTFNEDAVEDLEPVEAEKRFHVMARDDQGVLRGGIRAACYWNTLHIELLWISPDVRGGGIGRKLIEEAENFARENRCEIALVETTSWQAKPFYEKNGYHHMATLNNRPKGHSSHYLTKALV
jgi:GNAT superfamily N-acetyltransferase